MNHLQLISSFGQSCPDDCVRASAIASIGAAGKLALHHPAHSRGDTLAVSIVLLAGILYTRVALRRACMYIVHVQVVYMLIFI